MSRHYSRKPSRVRLMYNALKLSFRLRTSVMALRMDWSYERNSTETATEATRECRKSAFSLSCGLHGGIYASSYEAHVLT